MTSRAKRAARQRILTSTLPVVTRPKFDPKLVGLSAQTAKLSKIVSSDYAGFVGYGRVACCADESCHKCVKRIALRTANEAIRLAGGFVSELQFRATVKSYLWLSHDKFAYHARMLASVLRKITRVLSEMNEHAKGGSERMFADLAEARAEQSMHIDALTLIAIERNTMLFVLLPNLAIGAPWTLEQSDAWIASECEHYALRATDMERWRVLEFLPRNLGTALKTAKGLTMTAPEYRRSVKDHREQSRDALREEILQRIASLDK